MGSLLKTPSATSWQALHGSAESLFVGDCWTHCESYCCKTNHKEQKFSLMKCGSAGMVFPKKEYEFLKDNAHLQEGFESSAKEHNYVFDEERNLSLSFVTAHCDLGGLCTDAKWRPLICKFYPLYPVISPADGSVASYTYGSIIDQYWDALNVEHPCWLFRNHAKDMDEAINDSAASLMQHPYIVFYFGAANIFVNHVTARAKADLLQAPTTDPRKFFRDWELSYLMGQLVDSQQLRTDLTKLYDEIAERVGAFEI